MTSMRVRVRRSLARLREEIEDALEEEHTPRQVAVSFAIGVFITALPTLGVGVLVFFALAYTFASVSKVALFASVLVLNPAVKWGVYGLSFWLGLALMGPVEGPVTDISLSAAPDVVARLLVGNVLLAVVLTVVAYVVAYRITLEHRRRNLAEETLEDVIERLPEG